MNPDENLMDRGGDFLDLVEEGGGGVAFLTSIWQICK